MLERIIQRLFGSLHPRARPEIRKLAEREYRPAGDRATKCYGASTLEHNATRTGAGSTRADPAAASTVVG